MKSKRNHVNRNNTNPAYWNGILKGMGMGAALQHLPHRKNKLGRKQVMAGGNRSTGPCLNTGKRR